MADYILTVSPPLPISVPISASVPLSATTPVLDFTSQYNSQLIALLLAGFSGIYQTSSVLEMDFTNSENSGYIAALLSSFVGTYQEAPASTYRQPGILRGVNLASQYVRGVSTMIDTDWQILYDNNVDHIRIPMAGVNLFTDLTFTAFKPEAIARVDALITAAIAKGFRCILDCHPVLGSTDPITNTITNIQNYWSMVAGRYKDYDDGILYEILNEPEASLNDGGAWRTFHQNIIGFLRLIDPTPGRKILVDARYAGYPTGLTDMNPLRVNGVIDRDVIYSFHYYDPFPFTHQDSPFTAFDPIKGMNYETTAAETNALFILYGIAGTTAGRIKDYNRAQILLDFQAVKNWASANNLDIHCGEFGVWNEVTPAMGATKWFSDVIFSANAVGCPYTLFAYGSNFPLLPEYLAQIA